MGRSIIKQPMVAMLNQLSSPLQVLTSLNHTAADDRELLDGPDSGVGLDYWYRHRGASAEARQRTFCPGDSVAFLP